MSPANSPRAETIARLSRAVDNRAVLPVIGAGVSALGANTPLWGDLLRQSIGWTEENIGALGMAEADIAALRSAVDLDRPTLACYERWATDVFARANGHDPHSDNPLYSTWLTTFFGDLTPTDTSVYDAIRSLEARVLLTTNYDKMLESQVMPDGQSLTWEDAAGIERLLREDRGILHLHGVFDDARSVILTAGDYGRIVDRHTRDIVAERLSRQFVLLLIGISPAGATDRHLAHLLRAAQPVNRAHSNGCTHVLLHRGEIAPSDSVRLRALDIEPVSFGSEYEQLPSFLSQLSETTSARSEAYRLASLSPIGGVDLAGSRWEPKQCLSRVQSTLQFMGLRSSKWVRDADSFNRFDALLGQLDAFGGTVQFLIVDPRSDAFSRLETMRGTTLDLHYLRRIAELINRHGNFEVRCIDFLPSFRITMVDDREVGLGLYPTTREEFESTLRGWRTTHYTLSLDRPWTLPRALRFLFHEHFRSAVRFQSIVDDLLDS
jgi:hypothetical protein